MKYIVKVPVEIFLEFSVTASSEKEAKKIVGSGDGELLTSLTSEQLEELNCYWDDDINNWLVDEEEEE